QTSAPSSACNNLTRTLLIGAGTSQTSVQCGQWSVVVSIAGQSITVSSPPECLTSQVVRTGDTFGCSGTANGIHCTTNGDQVHVKTRVNPNPCPGFPAPPPTTWAEVRAALAGAPLGPEIVEVNHSASIKNCTSSVPGHWRADGDVVGQGADSFQVRIGDPRALLTPPVGNAAYAELVALETAELTSLPPILRQTLEAAPARFGFRDVLATAEYRYAVPGSSEPVVERRRFEGVVLADQRFDLTKTYRAAGPDADPTVVSERLVFDGASLFTHVTGNSTGNVWCSSSPRRDALRASEAHAAALLADWAYRPFWILRVTGTLHAVESAPDSSIVTVTESYPWASAQGFPLGTTTYSIDASGSPKPTSIVLRDFEGHVQLRREYSDYRRVDSAAWRPFSIVESRYQPGSVEPWIVIELRIQHATPLAPSEAPAFARPAFADEVWFVRR
ncbi:MAG: hypothetical protein JNK02_10875, partial [Planctomycetes bacterium]|nr:hypothetical protein [Planctomycetota bacterium]